ncbi:P-loop containing nucleoside triphosphate hydrolase protein [Melanomma pulvis-pyrius CBS 109.77]|uniref:P-loop containing nucleoside triphosphate hydrolase protein n=1 Tax=Melanomma pulvis-pyrius CBS 109.77 TaxID=1314802 RepID=A0A6A6XEC6_9PLEO|nr:P-loop containing nucleoside triphosphate hydrolase protein [Melanomma pulvis-pyrius CBS 109.77]
MTGNNFALHAHEDQTSREYFHHSSAQRVNTNAVVVEALRTQYPNLDLIVVPKNPLNLIAYASAGFATATPLEDSASDPVYGAGLKWRSYIPPARRLDNRPGVIAESILFGKYMYKWKDQEFILYIASGRDGDSSYPDITMHYILTKETHKVDELLKEATVWGVELHDEVWVFDQGYWQKSRELWDAVQKSHWEDVILEEGMKKAIIADVDNFFDGQETYGRLKVPWKRGIIYYGPPGNGKTISIKAMMHALYQRGLSNNKMSVPTLYVRTLTSFAGPEYSLRAIFAKAREAAPCYLVFEDLDSIVDDHVRSYFLNEVDGLKSNDGILMVGSTNHLDRLDPGISKRPSRFDRKYYFPDPNYEQRIAYAKFWQSKLKSNSDLEFPDELCPAIAKITDKFSFAYMQEAFVASLLAIAVRGDSDEADEAAWYAGPQDPVSNSRYRATVHKFLSKKEMADDELDDLVLWKEMQVQVKILKEEMEEKSGIKTNDNRPSFRSPRRGTLSQSLMYLMKTGGGGVSGRSGRPLKRIPIHMRGYRCTFQ